jgi:hypothetical protein
MVPLSGVRRLILRRCEGRGICPVASLLAQSSMPPIIKLHRDSSDARRESIGAMESLRPGAA